MREIADFERVTFCLDHGDVVMSFTVCRDSDKYWVSEVWECFDAYSYRDLEPSILGKEALISHAKSFGSDKFEEIVEEPYNEER
jgi:hypothetical protein